MLAPDDPLLVLLWLAWAGNLLAHLLRRLRPHPVVLVLPAVALLVVLFNPAPASLGQRVESSRAAIDALAREVVAAPPSTRFRPRSVGYFRARNIERIPGGMRFIVRDCGLDECGFAYSPGGPAAVINEDGYSHLAGPWYAWHQSW